MTSLIRDDFSLELTCSRMQNSIMPATIRTLAPKRMITIVSSLMIASKMMTLQRLRNGARRCWDQAACANKMFGSSG